MPPEIDPNAPKVDPVVEPPKAGDPPKGAEPPKAADPPKEPPKVEPKPEPKEDWRDQRIAVLTAKLRGEEAARRAAEEKVTGKPVPTLTEDEVNKRAEALASTKTAEQLFAKECNDMIEDGHKVFGKEQFEEKLTSFKKLLDPSDKEASAGYWTLVRAALDTGDGAKVIHQLGDDLDEAARLMKLSPTKMGVELAKLAAKDPPEPVTDAKKPITPVGQRTSGHVKIEPDDGARADQLSTAEWMERRNAQVAERWERQRGRKSA